MANPDALCAEWLGGHTGRLTWPGGETACAFGRSGVIDAGEKREGDGATPLGVWPIRRVLYRPDRVAAPDTSLMCRALVPDDGWCDAPGDPAYNRPVRLPYPTSHETMWREDGLYDFVVVLGHNDSPPMPGVGSAIFFHCAKGADGSLAGATDGRDNLRPTEGCVAIARDVMVSILRTVCSKYSMCIRRAVA